MARLGYARVSTSDQHPEAQQERLKAAGCEVVYTDKGVSGALASRPQWDRCLAALHAGDTLVAVKLDRFGRSVRNLVAIADDLRERGVDLECLDQAIDTRSPQGKAFYGMLSVFAEFERNLIIERTRDGMESRRAEGKVMGGSVAFGYKLKDGVKTRDEAALKVVAEVFQRSARGESTATIADWLRRCGYKRRDNTIADLLRNPDYVADGVVSGALARAAVDALESRRTGPARRTSEADYSAMIWCRCGRKMHRVLAGGMPAKGVESTRYYRCREHEGKPVPMVRADDADALVEHAMSGDWMPWLKPVRIGGDTREADKARLMKQLPKARTRAETDAIWDEIEAVEAREPEPERTEWVPSGQTRGDRWEQLTIPERRAWLEAEETRITCWNVKHVAEGTTEEAPDGTRSWSRGKVRMQILRDPADDAG